MHLHREGNTIIFITVLIALATGVLIALDDHFLHWILKVFLGLTVLIMSGLIIQFFRVPNRNIAGDVSEVVCPADGKVVVIERVFEPEFLKKDCMQISIFMSPLNVHANYVPIGGKVIYTQYHKGKYLVAWHPKSSTENERSTLVIETSNQQQVLVRQIAGALARRICFYPTVGKEYQKGDEFGFIKFGSRVDVFLPMDAEIKVSIGQVVKNREDILASI